ncbi:hypothetical protein OH77DRAFT_1593282 [Trametes cingulata]|nr:hypothetical protein OH77DRAFT_1593282 [Trametes cingulata]
MPAAAIIVMNGAEPNHAKALPARPEQISQALLDGARELSALLEKRVATLRAEYEDRLRALTQERDGLLAKLGDGSANIARSAEDFDAFQQERASWQQDRAEWWRLQARHVTERGAWEEERRLLVEERDRLRQEAEELRKAREEWESERVSLRQQLEQAQLEQEKQLQELAAAKIATIDGLEAQVQWLEAAQNDPGAQLDAGFNPSEFDPLNILQSPPRSTTYAGMSSTLGTSTPARSPSQDPMAMQVRTPPPTFLPLDVGWEFDWYLAPLPDAQVDAPRPQSPSKSPTLSLRGGQSPPKPTVIRDHGAQSPPKSPTITLRGGQSPATARSPTMSSVARTSQSSSLKSAPTRLFIRVPPSTGKTRKPIKPPPSPPTEEERKLIVHVPPSQNVSDEGSPSKSSTTSSSESSSESLSSP